MNEINISAVFAATFVSFIFGALWYSPLLFLSRWCKETGVDPNKNISNPARVYGVTFLFTLISAFALAIILGEEPELFTALLTGGLVGAGLVVTSMGVNYQFAGRSLMHWLIDSFFQIFRFIIMGLVLGLWH
ncbi:MAG: DUF1761 domain-containing protein [Cycloclasticus sp.]|nr:DUF1761 domain-containing protein [Cycloclasticus sp.]